MRPRKALNELSRLMNLNLRCPRCDEPITRLAAHMDRYGKPICLLKSPYDREMDRLAAEHEN